MNHPFEITALRDHHNRGQFIFARRLQVDQPLVVPNGALLNGIAVYHYDAIFPIGDPEKNPNQDMYVFRPDLQRYPEGHFLVGQVVELVLPEKPA
jgi:hypothetical protein